MYRYLPINHRNAHQNSFAILTVPLHWNVANPLIVGKAFNHVIPSLNLSPCLHPQNALTWSNTDHCCTCLSCNKCSNSMSNLCQLLFCDAIPSFNTYQPSSGTHTISVSGTNGSNGKGANVEKLQHNTSFASDSDVWQCSVGESIIVFCFLLSVFHDKLRKSKILLTSLSIFLPLSPQFSIYLLFHLFIFPLTIHESFV